MIGTDESALGATAVDNGLETSTPLHVLTREDVKERRAIPLDKLEHKVSSKKKDKNSGPVTPVADKKSSLDVIRSVLSAVLSGNLNSIE